MAYFHTNYDASNLMVSVDDAEVTRALGVLGNKTPAALKVAVNTTARQTRKLMLTEVKKRYDLERGRQTHDRRSAPSRQKATNRRPTAILAIMKTTPVHSGQTWAISEPAPQSPSWVRLFAMRRPFFGRVS